MIGTRVVSSKHSEHHPPLPSRITGGGNLLAVPYTFLLLVITRGYLISIANAALDMR